MELVIANDERTGLLLIWTTGTAGTNIEGGKGCKPLREEAAVLRVLAFGMTIAVNRVLKSKLILLGKRTSSFPLVRLV